MYTRKEAILMTTTRIFQNGNSQALRIPHELRTDKKEYYINKIGDIYIAYPAEDPWAPVRQVIGTFPEDYMADREQPSWDSVPRREAL
jgi:antitoxin VapB